VNAERRAANAALLLGALVASIAMAPARSSQSHCGVPVERAFDAGSRFTTEVACDVAQGGAELRGPARLLFGQRLDLNRASSLALESLPSIGPLRADAIVRARSERRFDSLADLARVPGIGRKTCEGLDGWVTVAGPAVDGDPKAPSGGGTQWTTP